MSPILQAQIQCPHCGSGIVYSVRHTFLERFIDRFVPNQALRCQACNYRFLRFSPPCSRPNRRRLLMAGSVIVVLVVCGILFLSHGVGQNHTPALPAPVTAVSAVKKAPPAAAPSPTKEAALSPAATAIEPIPLRLQNSRKFMVNWDRTEQGLRITRMADGPMQRAGLHVGDVIISFDGQPLTSEKPLLAARDEIFAGTRSYVTLYVRRGQTIFHFILQK